MTHDNLIQQSAFAIAQAEKQVDDQSFQLREMHAGEYGTEMQILSYEKLLNDQLELKKLRVRHKLISEMSEDQLLLEPQILPHRESKVGV